MTTGKLTTLLLSVLVLSSCSLFHSPRPDTGAETRAATYRQTPEPGRAFLLCVIDNSLPNHKTAMWQVGAVDERGRTTDLWFHRQDLDKGARPDLILLGEPYVYRGFCPGVENEDFRGLVDHYQKHKHRKKHKKQDHRNGADDPEKSGAEN